MTTGIWSRARDLVYTQAWREGGGARDSATASTDVSSPPLYWATVDIRHCFDSIPHEMLLQVHCTHPPRTILA